MVKIIAPNKQYTGISAGVSFVHGEGETDNPHLIEWFKSKGYEVEVETKESTEPPKDEEADENEEEINEVESINFDEITVAEIKGKLDASDISYGTKETKEVLFEKLTNATNEPTE